MTTSAAELRRAAEKLRALATEAPPGPWTRRIHQGRKHGQIVQVELHQPPRPGSNMPEIRHYSPHAGPEVAYTATMHPGVGLAVADWLDAAARAHDASVTAAANAWPETRSVAERGAWVARHADQHALAVARQILGTPATPASTEEPDTDPAARDGACSLCDVVKPSAYALRDHVMNVHPDEFCGIYHDHPADAPVVTEEPEFAGPRQCGHDDYHDAHEWADLPHIWCPGYSLTEEPTR
ncbi:hypothetical protein AB0J01_38025 [Streptomyces sp. NPDC050204]|uniref:hypothetical protein n=1 Tax=Streptomyces sp. NPDC050204 TaxID=3155514 RepID=UPI003429A9ED